MLTWNDCGEAVFHSECVHLDACDTLLTRTAVVAGAQTPDTRNRRILSERVTFETEEAVLTYVYTHRMADGGKIFYS
jgi:hypothetical protein